MTGAVLALLLAATAGASVPRIGAAGAVAGTVKASSAGGGAARALASGADVFHKDAVTTDAKGKLQLMLLDQTVFTVGPDSQIVLDEFIYDPFTDAGKVTAQVTKGVFRFVTGRVAGKDPTSMKIKIPSGTIGIRGTFGAGSVQPNGETLIALLGPGPDNNGGERVGGLDVETGNDNQSLDEPGTGVTVGSDGQVSDPFTLSPEQMDSLDAGGSGTTGGTGGSSGGGTSSAGSSSSADDDDDGGSDAAATGSNAADDAGADDAAAGEDAGETGELGDSQSGLGEDTTQASQDAADGGILDGFAQWEDVRTLETGGATYTGTGDFTLTTCNGGTCDAPSGSFELTLNVNFANRTYGGGCGIIDCANSSVSGSASDSVTETSINFSHLISETSFDALTGPAKFSVGGASDQVDFDFINAGGVAATSLTATVSYDDGLNAASGSLSAPAGDYGGDKRLQ